MNLPFTKSDFFDVFARYNQAIWPAHYFLVSLAVLAVIAIVRGWKDRDRIASGVLALLWLWSGVVYHLLFFSEINRLAIAFGVLFLAQSGGWLYYGFRRRSVGFAPHFPSARAIAGGVIIAYALAIYPWLSIEFGHSWPHSPTFGAPCPVVLFTLGLLLWSDVSRAKALLIVPLGWTVLGMSAAVQFGMHEDWALIAAGVVTAVFLLPRRRTQPGSRHLDHPPKGFSPPTR